MPLLDFFWTMLMIFVWVLWFWFLITVFTDIFRSDDLTGWGKAGWAVFTLVLPYLGVFVYMIARGRSMGERRLREQQEMERATSAYIREVASRPSTADELATLARLRDTGALTQEEFTAEKAKLLTGAPSRTTPAEPVG